MRTFGNIVWHVPFCGFVTAAICWLLGFLLTAMAATAASGRGLMAFAGFLLGPFTQALVREDGAGSLWRIDTALATLIYVPVALAIAAMLAVEFLLTAFSIIGIPIALMIAYSSGPLFNPVGWHCVPVEKLTEEARSKNSGRFEETFRPFLDFLFRLFF